MFRSCPVEPIVEMQQTPSRFSEILPAVLSVSATSAQECRLAIDQAQTGDWTQAEITNYDDNGMLSQHVDLKARNVEVKGPTQIPTLCEWYCSLLTGLGAPIVRERWGISGLRLSGTQLAKYEVGSHIRPHNDTATEFSARCVSALLYLNEDYEGGELIFPRLGATHRAKAGELVLFPSEYLHAVSPVLKGTRYCFVGFFLAEAFGNWAERLNQFRFD
ncbi:Fe(II)-dependent oxygenase [Pandoraea apista]|uniref:Fe(II)-dependent oxygenase n=2 Tax=Pandoraea apista TaxID=93218 RepID=A0A5E5P4I4_9BURK|nr:Fe(II)-dependent oxygenase [Pandoraea apista]